MLNLVVDSLSIPSTSILASQEFGPVNQFNQLNQEIYDTLMKGLGDRVKLIYLKHSKPTPWHLASSRSIDESCRNIVIGVLLDAERSRRSIDYGPSAEDKTAAIAFRGFWGPKAELRRFKDGSILESLIWSKTDSNNSILDQIILFVLQRHFTQKITDGMTSQGAAFRRLLNQNLISSNPTPLFHSTEIAFKNLEKSIRGIEGLPLQIRQISTSSSTIRFASRNAQILSLGTHNVRPEHIYVQFEGSSRWPDDLLAIQRTKIAFLLKIGDLMERSTTGLTTRLGLENNTHRLLNQAFLDVFYPGRVIFRLRIHHERELDILEQSLKDRANDLRSKKEKALAVAVYKRDFILGPLHTQAMRTLSTRFPFLLDSMRLMKIWRDSHLLSAHISDEIIEHLTIRTFVQPYPWPVPASIMSGFLRTLFFVSRWDWQFEPLIVDFNHDMTSKDIEGIYLRFDAWRRADPSMNRVVMFSASKLDPEGIIWTQQRPCKVVAARFSSLAKAACNHIVCQGLNLQVDELFITSITDYDFIIHLSPELSSSKTDRDLKQPTFKNFLITSGECPSPKTSNILQAFLEEVSIFYEKCILFFYNVTNISLIAGLWTSQVGSRDWKVSTTSSTMPMQHMGDTDAKATINKAAILHDIARLGGNLVSRIEVKR